MKKAKFNIRNRNNEIEEVEGYKFELGKFRFGIHDMSQIANEKAWTVRELDSGAIFYSGSKNESRLSCISGTQARIKKYGATDCKRRISDYINEYSKTGKAN